MRDYPAQKGAILMVAMILPGMDLIDRLRAHISDERELIDRFVKLAGAAAGAKVE